MVDGWRRLAELEAQAATTVQACYRGHTSRRAHEVELRRENDAAITVQAYALS